MSGKVSRPPDERVVPVLVLAVPVDELPRALLDGCRRFVADEFARLRNVGVRVLGVRLVPFVELYFERRVDDVTYGTREFDDFDVVGASDVQGFAVGGVGFKEC